MRTGGCLCGALRYELEGEPVVVAICHCRDCQKLSGAGHATGALVATAQLRLAGSAARYRTTARSGTDVVRTFCPTCGSPISTENSGKPGFITVMLGSLDEPVDWKPSIELFARNRKPWDRDNATVQSFDTQPE